MTIPEDNVNKFKLLTNKIVSLESKLSEKEAELQEHKDTTLDGDCQKCDYDSFTKEAKKSQSRIEKLEKFIDRIKNSKCYPHSSEYQMNNMCCLDGHLEYLKKNIE